MPDSITTTAPKDYSRQRRWYRAHAERERIRCKTNRKAYFAKNREKVLAINRAWASRNKDKIRLRDLRRKALLASAKVNLEGIEQWIRSVRSKKTFICYYCQHRKSLKLLHIDHIIPLVKGGEHSVLNLCTSCAACNCSKQAKSISAWIRIGQQVLEL